MDDAHLDSFLEDFVVAGNGRQRVAATLFFHEHVVAIHKLRKDPTDIVNIHNMPLKEAHYVNLKVAKCVME
eukprot:9191708-Ditylum_brightwellii.AAC.1